jgi:hypothetical protein
MTRPFVGLMTSMRLERAQVMIEQGSGATIVAILTVGLSHPIAAGVSEAAPSLLDALYDPPCGCLLESCGAH